MTQIHPGAAAPSESVGAGTRRYVLTILVIAYTFNFIDRQILGILVEPIRLELGVGDTAMGLLTGLAFAVFYTLMGIPIARYADRANRRNLIAAAVGIWSLFTAAQGLAQNYWQLLAYRVGVGVGEAGCSPPAHSMLSDYYPANQRATALGIYSLGIPVGILFGFFVGGWMNEWFGWRVAFLVVGIPGIVLALVIRFTVREPERGMSEQRANADPDADQPAIGAVFRYLLGRRSFIHMALGGGISAFVGYGLISWSAAFLARSHGLSSGEIGTWLGLIFGIPGGIGIVLGGRLADHLGERDTRWYLWVVAVALLIAVPAGVGVFLSDSVSAALLFLIIPVILGNFYQATTFAQTQTLVGLRMRSVAAAILLFVINIVGLAFGPSVVGVLSDMLAPHYGLESLRWALLICSMANLWAAFHYWRAGVHFPGDLQRVED
ncbi:spinster family MFS transporter [Chromatocurvus halotolerans]|uniref:Putative MFS family arabinose efflux permease n=1 Tax=Chromatocurvus halotolerans TaxID=1132028 RepID=A0A4R2LEG1_9GAMM|nr:MFS transporter [Chromatocurvus halotolerans]TCO77695.1 putative MFS family arabinose efflux permease [Chromatocurvus halotolerans]